MSCVAGCITATTASTAVAAERQMACPAVQFILPPLPPSPFPICVEAKPKAWFSIHSANVSPLVCPPPSLSDPARL